MTEAAKLYNHLKRFSTLADFKQWSRPLDDLDGSGPIRPLTVSANGQVVPGTVGGIMPTILGRRLDADPPNALNISPTGTQYVVIRIQGTMSTASYAGASFVAAAMTDVTVTITVETSSPTGADMLSTTGTFKLLLATFVDGIKTHQGMIGPVTFIIQDTLDGSGTGYLAHASN